MQCFKAFEAPKNYTFIDPDTGHIYLAKNQDSLIEDIVAYRAQNGLPQIDELPAVLQNYWCSLPQNVGKCKDCGYPIGFIGYIRGGITLLKTAALKHFATQEEAEKRAAQCVTCKYNSFPDRGPFLTWIHETAISIVGERKTKVYEKLGVCAVCQCPIRAKVFVGEKLPPFTPKQTELLASVDCWQLKQVEEKK